MPESEIVLPAVWPRAATPPLRRARLRARPEDFVVEELPLVTPSGDGEHLWVQVRKRGWTTPDVARALARWAGVPARQVGYAGLKDRHALTVQWFSLHLPGRPDPPPQDWPAGIELLAVRRHGRKLQRGALRGNRFRLRLREVEGDGAALARRVEVLARQGFPNYFGPQRFGRHGDNLRQAADWFAGRRRVRGRGTAAMLLSAVRGYLFNRVLGERVSAGSWRRALPGELMMLAGSRSLFPAPEPDAALQSRIVAGDAHPTGPLPGRAGGLQPQAAVAALEAAVMERHPALLAGLAARGVQAARRPLRALPVDLSLRPAGDGLWLDFALGAGSYATALLAELVETLDEGPGA